MSGSRVIFIGDAMAAVVQGVEEVREVGFVSDESDRPGISVLPQCIDGSNRGERSTDHHDAKTGHRVSLSAATGHNRIAASARVSISFGSSS